MQIYFVYGYSAPRLQTYSALSFLSTELNELVPAKHHC